MFSRPDRDILSWYRLVDDRLIFYSSASFSLTQHRRRIAIPSEYSCQILRLTLFHLPTVQTFPTRTRYVTSTDYNNPHFFGVQNVRRKSYWDPPPHQEPPLCETNLWVYSSLDTSFCCGSQCQLSSSPNLLIIIIAYHLLFHSFQCPDIILSNLSWILYVLIDSIFYFSFDCAIFLLFPRCLHLMFFRKS